MWKHAGKNYWTTLAKKKADRKKQTDEEKRKQQQQEADDREIEELLRKIDEIKIENAVGYIYKGNGWTEETR